MLIEFLSIMIFSFALALFVLGGITWWIERGQKRTQGVLMMICGLIIAVAYAFLGSRFSIAVFDRLIITIDLPRLMTTAITYTIGVLSGFGIAGGIFLWFSGRASKSIPLGRNLVFFIAAILIIALIISIIAVQISQ